MKKYAMNITSIRVLAIIIAFIAFTQIYGIGERVISAFWGWYKFYGYGETSDITIGTTMAIFTFFVSIVVVAISFIIQDRAKDVLAVKLAKWSMYSLLIGIASLLALLASPLANLYPR